MFDRHGVPTNIVRAQVHCSTSVAFQRMDHENFQFILQKNFNSGQRKGGDMGVRAACRPSPTLSLFIYRVKPCSIKANTAPH